MEEIINNSNEMDIQKIETCKVFESGICEMQSHDGCSEIYNLEKNTDSVEKPKVDIQQPCIAELNEIIPNEIAPQPFAMPEKNKTPEIENVVKPVTIESAPPVDCNPAPKKPNAISNKRKSDNHIESNIEEKKNYSMRKNLRGVINENNFDTITIAAQREESERLARVQELKKSVKQRYAHTTLEAMLQDLPYEGGPRREKYPPSCETQTLSQLNKRSTFDLIDNKLHRVDVGRSEKKLWNQWLSSERTNALAEDKCEVVTVDSSSEDECIILSDSDDCMDDPEEDHHNSGLHVRDVLNIPNEHGKVLVNVGHVEGEPDIFVAPQIAKVIKPHQIGGVRFLFDNIIESTKRFNNSSGFGCILAHSMGLGKTLQVVCFSDIFLRHTDAKTILCVMPINTIQNWVKEFNIWIPEESPNPDEVRPRKFKVFALNDQHKTMSARANVIFRWYTQGGVLLIGYELFRVLGLKIIKRKEGKKPLENTEHKRLLDQMHMALVKPGPDLVICDEGHRIKNAHAGISIALKQIRSRRRIVLTGYPLQNNLLEYWCMVDFVRPNYLGSKTEFCNMFERPIQNGQCVDSTPEDIKLMRYRAHVLHSLLVGFVQRRSDSVLQSSLPQKLEYVILTKMTALQRNLYEAFMNEVVRKKKVPNPLKAFAVCCKIWNHPDVLYNFLKKRESECDLEIDEPCTPNDKSTKDEVPPKEFVNTAENTFTNDPNYTNTADLKSTAGSKENPPAGAMAKATTDATIRDQSKSSPSPQIIDLETKEVQFIKSEVGADLDLGSTPGASNVKQGKLDVDSNLINMKMAKSLAADSISYDWALNLVKNYEPGIVNSSPKMEVFLYILEESVKLGDRVLLFSQSLLTLNLMELFLQRSVIPDSEQLWKKNVSYFRLDGSTSALEREKLVNEFNNNTDVKLFLISTRAGSLGINLTGANRVVVFDASWNPCHDTQAVHRVYRYGQSKSCFVYRIVMDSCLEKNIYDRQVKKQGMSDRVVDECNPDAHLSIRELTNLCYDRVEEIQNAEFKQPLENYSDVVMRQVITNYKSILSKEPFYHESLLIDRKEKKLSQTEKKLAKRGYEIEKKASTKPNFLSHNVEYKIMQNKDCMLNQVIPRVPPFKKIIREPLRNSGMKLPRWIPAEVWQRQGMSSQEMKLPIDVAIPTSSSESSSIVVKAGEKVMVLKSPKGVYMQLESGKIIAIKTSTEAAQEREKIKAKKVNCLEISDKKSINTMDRMAFREDRPNRCHARLERSSTESDKDDVIVINDSINDSVETSFDSSYSKQKSRTVDLNSSKDESRAQIFRNKNVNDNMTTTTAATTAKAAETSFDLSYSKHRSRPDLNPRKEDSIPQHFRNKNEFPSTESRKEKQDTPILQAHQEYIQLPETESSPGSNYLEQPTHNNYFGSTPNSSNYENHPSHNIETPQYSIPTIHTNRWETKSPDAYKQTFKISNIPAPYPSTTIFDKNEKPQTQSVNDIINVDQYAPSYIQSCKESEDHSFHHTHHNLNMNSNYYNSSLSATPCVEDNGSYNAMYQYDNKNEINYSDPMYENSNNYHQHMSKYSYGYYQPQYLPNYNNKMYDNDPYSSQFYMRRPSNYSTNATNAVDVGLNYAEPQGWVKKHLPD